jgi:hypothetical protein
MKSRVNRVSDAVRLAIKQQEKLDQLNAKTFVDYKLFLTTHLRQAYHTNKLKEI